MTDAELEARARRAYEAAMKYHRENGQPFATDRPWSELSGHTTSVWLAAAEAVLEEPPADPFEEWWESTKKSSIEYRGPGAKDCAHAAWDAATAYERAECAELAYDTGQITDRIRKRGEKP